MQLFVRICGRNTAVLELPPAATVSDLGSRLSEDIDNFTDMRILCGTRSLDLLSSNVVLEEIGIRTESTIQVMPRFRGGGGDGGATGAESRSSYLEMYAKKKTLKVNPKEEKLAAWTQCRMTHEPLSTSEEGVVVDPLGFLYNKATPLAGLASMEAARPWPLPHGGAPCLLGSLSTGGGAALASPRGGGLLAGLVSMEAVLPRPPSVGLLPGSPLGGRRRRPWPLLTVGLCLLGFKSLWEAALLLSALTALLAGLKLLWMRRRCPGQLLLVGLWLLGSGSGGGGAAWPLPTVGLCLLGLVCLMEAVLPLPLLTVGSACWARCLYGGGTHPWPRSLTVGLCLLGSGGRRRVPPPLLTVGPACWPSHGSGAPLPLGGVGLCLLGSSLWRRRCPGRSSRWGSACWARLYGGGAALAAPHGPGGSSILAIWLHRGPVGSPEVARVSSAQEAVLQALLENRQTKKGMPAGLEHIRSLKELTPLKLSRPGTSVHQAKESKPTTARTFQPGNESDFCCPLTGRPMSGTARFVALKPCGWVFSESAVKQAAPAVEEMIGTKLEGQEILPINGTEEEVVALSEKLSEKRLSQKSKKSGKAQDKRKAGDGVEAAGGKTAKVQKWNGCDDMATVLAQKEAEKYKASNHVPEGATKSVYASIFTSSSVFDRKETYGARSLSFQR
ncbi:hypothetical protein CYMTET_7511 [Cymbomonas tetramitiformis]|uniref:Ubiquitin-like domain-containing protein n=1 Tax=Cymbomonas tetramitiformis TaxID=36881 RepID=A0AAE0GUV6_9CHLO|nr:hypothetical protein CYMTET_7511 [Cymbomonas tetramitiformis]